MAGDERDDSPELKLSQLVDEDDVDDGGVKERAQHESPVLSVSACVAAFSSSCCLRRAYNEIEDLGDLGDLADVDPPESDIFDDSTSWPTAASNFRSCFSILDSERGLFFTAEESVEESVSMVMRCGSMYDCKPCAHALLHPPVHAVRGDFFDAPLSL